MARAPKVRSTRIKKISDVSPGDVIFTPNDESQLLLVARIYETTVVDKVLKILVCISTPTGKVYDVTESLIGLLSMRKIKL